MFDIFNFTWMALVNLFWFGVEAFVIISVAFLIVFVVYILISPFFKHLENKDMDGVHIGYRHITEKSSEIKENYVKEIALGFLSLAVFVVILLFLKSLSAS